MVAIDVLFKVAGVGVLLKVVGIFLPNLFEMGLGLK